MWHSVLLSLYNLSQTFARIIHSYICHGNHYDGCFITDEIAKYLLLSHKTCQLLTVKKEDMYMYIALQYLPTSIFCPGFYQSVFLSVAFCHCGWTAHACEVINRSGCNDIIRNANCIASSHCRTLLHSEKCLLAVYIFIGYSNALHTVTPTPHNKIHNTCLPMIIEHIVLQILPICHIIHYLLHPITVGQLLQQECQHLPLVLQQMGYPRHEILTNANSRKNTSN